MLAQVGQRVVLFHTVLSDGLGTQVEECVQQCIPAQVELHVGLGRTGVLALLVVRVDHLAAGLGMLACHDKDRPVRRHLQFLHDGHDVVDGDFIAVLPAVDVDFFALVHHLHAEFIVPAGQ